MKSFSPHTLHAPLLLLLLLLHLLLLQCAAASSSSILLGLPLRNTKILEDLFWKVSDPLEEEYYLQFRSVDELRELVGYEYNDPVVEEAMAWLSSAHPLIRSIKLSSMGDSISAEVLGDDDDLLLLTPPFKHDFFSVNPISENQVSFASSATASTKDDAMYTIEAIKNAYGMPTDLVASSNRVLQMVWGPGTYGYSPSDLASFAEDQVPLLNVSTVEFDTENHGTPGGDNWGECTLDVQMIASFGLGVKTLVSNTNTSSSTEEGVGFGIAFLNFLTELSSRDTIPQILSLSLGSLSPYSCDLLCDKAVEMGHTMEDCQSFMQEQRQVCMYLSESQAERIDGLLQVLALRGVSIFGSSGDGGSHFSFQKFPSTTQLGQDLNTIACVYGMPVYPTGSPYVVSVGGEVWDNGTPSEPIAWNRGGGGFSWQFASPSFQAEAVKAYLSSGETQLPPASSFNASQRAYPDIAAISQDGTSQSAPIAAGLFAMLTDLRFQQGLPPLGFLGPRIYQTMYALQREEKGTASSSSTTNTPPFDDILNGTTAFECDDGFSAASAWDPVTGWGRPNWKGMKNYFASDDDNLPFLRKTLR